MSDSPAILLAGEATYAILHDLLASGTFEVRVLTRDIALARVLGRLGVVVIGGGLDDCASIRTAVAGCYGVFAAATNVQEGRNLIKVVAGSEVESFVLITHAGRRQLERYAEAVGAEPVFVSLDSPDIAASLFFAERGEQAWRSSSLPFFL